MCQKCTEKCKQINKQLNTVRNHKETQKLRQMMIGCAKCAVSDFNDYTKYEFCNVNENIPFENNKLELVPMKKPKINDSVFEYIYYNYDSDFENGDNSFHRYLSKDKKQYIDLPFHVREVYYSTKDIDSVQVFKKPLPDRDKQKGFGEYFKYV